MLTLYWDICIITNVPRLSGGMADHLTPNQAGKHPVVQVPPLLNHLGGKTFVLPPIFIYLYLLKRHFENDVTWFVP